MTTRSKHGRAPRSLRANLAQPNHKFSKGGLALGIASALLAPLGYAEEQKVDLGVMKVEDSAIEANPNAEPGVPYKAKYSGDARHTRPLAETPQNIQVLTKAQIEDSGYTDLREILDAQPGITLGTGENGNAFGDRYIIRGQEARSDVFVDGLRDPGMTIRESFAVEQIEISKGPNSSFAGRGTAGGAINAVTKQATLDYEFTKISAGHGTDHHTRLTLDANQKLGETAAVRANALYGYEEVPDRAPADRERRGVALSGLLTPSDKLDMTLDYYGFRADDKPDIGGFLVGDVPNRRPAADVPVYLQEQDFLRSDVDTLTLRVNYAFSDTIRLSNLTRHGKTDNSYVVTGARSTATNANNPGGVFQSITLSTHQGWQEVDYFANQTNLFINANLGGMNHEFIVGAEFAEHDVLNGVFTVTNSGQNCATATSTSLNAWCVLDANGGVVNGVHTIMNRQIARGDWDQDWSITTRALSLMDTVDLTEKLSTFAGIRYDEYDYELMSRWNHDGDSGMGSTPNVLGDFKADDGMFNGHFGVTYELTDNGNIYASVATASDINGGESDVGTSSGYGGLAVNFDCVDRVNADPTMRGCNPNGSIEASPEKTRSVELGTKWNLLDEELLLTAAVFQIDKRNVMEGAGYDAGGSFNTGENRVRGIEVGVVGEITERLIVQAGATLMDAEVTASITDTFVGKTLSNFAEETAFAQIKYGFTDDFWLGAAMKYESVRYAGQPDTAPGLTPAGQYSQPIPSYSVHDLFAEYRFTSNLQARVNVGNVTDKDYYTAGYRSGAFLYMGDARNVRVTLNYEF